MRRIIFLLSILLATIGVSAQQTVTVRAQSYQVSDNLDLEAVAITFGEAKNVEDFERRLNDPENRISNLDLNNDGYVDFLRVVEVEEKGTHLIVIQAVIGENLYQDVATLIVEGASKTSATVTIVGNRDIYGSNYVIVPRYVVRPVIFDWFWLPTYAVYRSAWYWDYYPHYYHHYTCLGHHSYHRHIRVWHRHHPCDFHRPADYHHNHHHVELHRSVTRNDYTTHRPNHGYRPEPTPNHHVEARPTNNERRPGSLSTSPNNRVERDGAERTHTVEAPKDARRPSTITSTSRRPTSTSSNVSTSVTHRPTTLPARPTVPTERKTTSVTTHTTTNRSTTVAPRVSTTTNRSTTVAPRVSTTTSRSTTVAPRTSTTANRPATVTTSRSTSVRPATTTKSSSNTAVRTSTSTSRSTSVRTEATVSRPSNATTRTTTSAVKTNNNISTPRR